MQRASTTFQTMSTPFPIDLLSPIFKDIRSYDDLAHVSLTCKPANVEAERFLYREWPPVTAYDDPENFAEVMERHANFVASVMNNERRAAQVKSYMPPCLKPNDAEHWELVQEVLPRLTNLKSLRLNHISREIEFNILEGVKAQLETFHLTWTLATHQLEEILYPFLSEQKKLRRLYIQGHLKTPLPADACPELEYLSGSASAINAILPGRTKIKYLVWPAYETDKARRTPNFVETNAAVIKQLEWLSFGRAESNLRDDLLLFLPKLFSLKTLVLRHLGSDDDLALFRTLTKLKRIIIYAVDRGYGQQKPTPESMTPALKALFKRAKNLVYVDVSFEERQWGQPRISGHTATRWIRGKVQPDTIELKEPEDYIEFSSADENL